MFYLILQQNINKLFLTFKYHESHTFFIKKYYNLLKIFQLQVFIPYDHSR